MRYLPVDALDKLNAELTCVPSSDSNVHGRLETYCFTSHKQERRLFKRLESKYREDKQATDRAYADAADYERKRARRESLVSTTTTSGNESATTSPRPRPRSTSPRRSGHGGHGGHGHGAAAASAVASATVTTTATSATVTAPSAAVTSDVADAIRTDDLANMDDVSSRKTLFHLITTLNLTFPDYDFSSIKPQHFSMHTLPEVQQRVSAIFFQTGGDLYARCMSEKLWCALDEIIGPSASKMVPDGALLPVAAAVKGTTKSTAASAPPPATASPPLYDTPLHNWQDYLQIYAYNPDEATGAGDPYADDDASDGGDSVTGGDMNGDGGISGSGTIWSFFYFFFNKRLRRLVFFTMRGVGLAMGHGSSRSTTAMGSGSARSSEYGGDDHDTSVPSSPFASGSTTASGAMHALGLAAMHGTSYPRNGVGIGVIGDGNAHPPPLLSQGIQVSRGSASSTPIASPMPSPQAGATSSILEVRPQTTSTMATTSSGGFVLSARKK